MGKGFLSKIVQNIQSIWRDKSRRKMLNRLVFTGGIILVFMTTYIMILPAITVEKDRAKEMPGVYLESDSSHDEEGRTKGAGDSDHKTKDSPEIPENGNASNEADSFDNKSDDADASSIEDRDSKEDKKDLQPDNEEKNEDGDVSQFDSGTLTYRTPNYEISLSYDKEACIPRGTILNVETIPRESLDYIGYEEASKKLNQELTPEIFFKIKLLKAGREIHPAKPVDVTIKRLFDAKKPIECAVIFRREKEGMKAHLVTPEFCDEKNEDISGEDSDKKQKKVEKGGSTVNKEDVSEESGGVKDIEDKSSAQDGKQIILRTLPFNKKKTLPVIGLLYNSSRQKDQGNENEEDQSKDESQQESGEETRYDEIKYEDGRIDVTIRFKEGVLPEGASLKVNEIIPEDYESADTYAESITALSDSLRKEKQGLLDASVYDLTIYDANDEEIEPDGLVSVSFKYKKEKNLEGADQDQDVQLAHIKDIEGENEKPAVEAVDASVDLTDQGDISQVDFTTDSFSIYVLYSGTSVRSSNIEMPITGDAFGWISFVDPGAGNGGFVQGPLSNHFPLGSENGFKRAVQVKFYRLNDGTQAKNAAGEIITDNYTEMTVPETYFWTWQNSFTIENYDLKATVANNQRTALELVGTRYKTAWAELNMPEEHVIEADSLIGSYAVRGIQSADQTSYSLNTLDIYLKDTVTEWYQNTDMRYVVEYVHADGSRSEGKVKRMGSGNSVTINAANYVRSGEKYAGITVGTGYEAVSVNKAAGTATITYNSKVPLAKVTVYYQKAEEKNAEAVAPYDKDTKYDNARLGLHTDKKVTKVNDRDYELTFETWNIIQNAADVAMILDASGSMAWAAGNDTDGALTPITVDTSKLSGTYTKYNNTNTQGRLYNGGSVSYLTEDDVNRILNTHYTDNSKLNYSGYSYYVYCAYSDISEYVALGYSNFGNGTYQDMTSVNNNNFPILVQQYDGNGWYFVDTTGNPQYLYNGYKYSNKDYVGISATGANSWTSPFYNNNPVKPRFYIGTDGYLHCVYYKNNFRVGTGNGSFLWDSIVYEKTPTSKTKTEVLQDSIAQFTTILKGQMANSKMAMTRFSNENFTATGNEYNSRKKLVLLNWTTNSGDIIGAMNNISTNSGAAISNGQYNFTLTGGTVTKWGVQSYIENIKNQITGQDANDKNNKYIIIFTDGKDTGGDADSNTGGTTGDLIRNNTDSLVKQGYTVFTVLMRSKAMTEGSDQLTRSRKFLQYLATGNQNSNTENGVQKYFEADADDPTGMVEAFRKIALSITSLEGYTIQDYVDPRFNVLNSAGEILSVLDDSGNFTNGKTGSERIDWSTTGRQFTTQDGKPATLFYDKNKKMFYIQWTDQRIYSNAIGEEVVHPWGSTVRLQAKEDFIGGNDIVTNGDEAKQNRVYHPSFSNNSQTDPKHPAKDFPRTSVNVALLDLDSGHYEDTVFLGETIKPGDLLTYLESTVDENEYIEFLSRAGSRDGVNYLSRLAAGNEVAVDYRYLGSSNSKLYAGIDQQDDVIGKLVYTWVPVDENGSVRTPDSGNESSGWTSNAGFAADKTQDYRYKLSIRYVPAKQNSQVTVTLSDGSTTVLKTRDSELREYVPLNSVVFPGANEVTKQPVGDTVSEKSTDSLAVIHVVDGRIHIEKKTNKQELLTYFDTMSEDEMDFVFHLKKDSTNDYRKVTLKLCKEGTATNLATVDTTSADINIVITKDSVQAMQESDGKVNLISIWLTNLPKGNYTLSESIAGSEEYVLDSIDIVTDYTEEGYASAEDLGKYLAEASSSGQTVTWKIGNVPVNTQQLYLDCFNGSLSFPISLVQDAIKHVDPGLSTNNGKIYLNAQIGEASLENKLIAGSFTINKIDSKNPELSLEDVEFTLYKATVSGNEWTKSDQYGEPQVTHKDLNQPLALAQFSGLYPGNYLLYETNTKPGYILPANPWKVRVTKNNDLIEVTITDYEGNALTLEDDIITITNEAGVELPYTGGPGTMLYTILGAILIAGAGLAMCWKRKAA